MSEICGECKHFQYGDEFCWCRKYEFAVDFHDKVCREIKKVLNNGQV